MFNSRSLLLLYVLDVAIGIRASFEATLGRQRSKNSKNSSMAGKTRAANSMDEEQCQLDMAVISDKVSRSKSSQRELSDRMGRIEEELKVSMSKMMEMMEGLAAKQHHETGEISHSQPVNPPRRNQE